MERILCMECGKSVSTPVPVDTIVRAYVKCPECIEAQDVPKERQFADLQRQLAEAQASHARTIGELHKARQERDEDRAAIRDAKAAILTISENKDLYEYLCFEWMRRHAPAIARATGGGEGT